MRLAIVALALVTSGCATQFIGDPKIEGGAEGCRHECAMRDLEFAGMVVMGEYTDGCICVDRPVTSEVLMEGAVASVAGAVGVVMQMRAQEAQRRQAH